MLRVGLSGGIASGKSSVSRRLAERGAVVIDADLVAREVVFAGTPGLAEVVDRFGHGVLAEDGTLDRPALGQIVFTDENARKDLEAITHPRIVERTRELMAAAPDDAVVVHDIPLLVELGRQDTYALAVVVDVPEALRLHRLVELRGIPEQLAQAQIDAQASDAQRHAAADILLPNTGTLAELHDRVDRLWQDRLVPFEENLRLGRRSTRPEKLTLSNPDPAWADRARRVLARVEHALGDAAVTLDHIGSTSIPGLPAKDVLDLQIGVRDLEVLDDARLLDRLATVGLLAPDQEWFDHAHDAADSPTTTGATVPKRMLASADPGCIVHGHVRVVGSSPWRRALLFRDWVQSDAEVREEYAALKADLAGRGLSTSDYAEAKEPWFARAFPRAEQWAQDTGWAPPATG